MDLVENHTEIPVFRHSPSMDRASSGGRSLKRSSSYSYAFRRLIIGDEFESESVSEAGDIGDRALSLHCNSTGGSGSSRRFRLSLDNVGEKNVVVPISDDSSFKSEGNSADIRDATVQSLDVKKLIFVDHIGGTILFTWNYRCMLSDQEFKLKLNGLLQDDGAEEDHWLLKYFSCLAILALFGILGVCLSPYKRALLVIINNMPDE